MKISDILNMYTGVNKTLKSEIISRCTSSLKRFLINTRIMKWDKPTIIGWTNLAYIQLCWCSSRGKYTIDITDARKSESARWDMKYLYVENCFFPDIQMTRRMSPFARMPTIPKMQIHSPDEMKPRMILIAYNEASNEGFFREFLRCSWIL